MKSTQIWMLVLKGRTLMLCVAGMARNISLLSTRLKPGIFRAKGDDSMKLFDLINPANIASISAEVMGGYCEMPDRQRAYARSSRRRWGVEWGWRGGNKPGSGNMNYGDLTILGPLKDLGRKEQVDFKTGVYPDGHGDSARSRMDAASEEFSVVREKNAK